MSQPSAQPDRDDGWTVTLAFWGTLLAAGTLFAIVALAPKLHTLAALDAEYAESQFRLVELERRANGLRRVAEALEHDPTFATELAKLEFAASRPGDERIAVPEDLQLGGNETALADRFDARATVSIPPALLEPLATHLGLRVALLSMAASLALAAFVVLNDEHAATIRSVCERIATFGRGVTERYRSA